MKDEHKIKTPKGGSFKVLRNGVEIRCSNAFFENKVRISTKGCETTIKPKGKS